MYRSSKVRQRPLFSVDHDRCLWFNVCARYCYLPNAKKLAFSGCKSYTQLFLFNIKISFTNNSWKYDFLHNMIVLPHSSFLFLFFLDYISPLIWGWPSLITFDEKATQCKYPVTIHTDSNNIQIELCLSGEYLFSIYFAIYFASYWHPVCFLRTKS